MPARNSHRLPSTARSSNSSPFLNSQQIYLNTAPILSLSGDRLKETSSLRELAERRNDRLREYIPNTLREVDLLRVSSVVTDITTTEENIPDDNFDKLLHEKVLIDFEAFDSKQPPVVNRTFYSLNGEDSLNDPDIAVNDIIKETNNLPLFSQCFLNKFPTKSRCILPNTSSTAVNELRKKELLTSRKF